MSIPGGRIPVAMHRARQHAQKFGDRYRSGRETMGGSLKRQKKNRRGLEAVDYRQRIAELDAMAEPTVGRESTNAGEVPEKAGTKMSLSIEEQTRAREIIVAAEKSLTEDEKKLCKDLGITESDYLAERKRKLDEKLPGADGLTRGEREAARATGVSPEQYARAKATK